MKRVSIVVALITFSILIGCAEMTHQRPYPNPAAATLVLAVGTTTPTEVGNVIGPPDGVIPIGARIVGGVWYTYTIARQNAILKIQLIDKDGQFNQFTIDCRTINPYIGKHINAIFVNNALYDIPVIR